jgi:hypothetical protein
MPSGVKPGYRRKLNYISPTPRCAAFIQREQRLDAVSGSPMNGGAEIKRLFAL